MKDRWSLTLSLQNLIFGAFCEPVFLLLVHPSVFFVILVHLSDVMVNVRGVIQFPAFSVCTINQDDQHVRRKEIHTRTFKYTPCILNLGLGYSSYIRFEPF